MTGLRKVTEASQRLIESQERDARKWLFRAVGKYLGERRQAVGWTQSQIAQAAGYSSQFISNIECGAAFPPSGLLASMIEHYKIPQEEFLQVIMDFQLTYYREVFFKKPAKRARASDVASRGSKRRSS